MIFICDLDYEHLSPFERILKGIQMNFNCFYEIMNSLVKKNPQSITCTPEQVECLLPTGIDIHRSHSHFRCWSSRRFLELLVGFDLLPLKDPEPGDVEVTEVSIGGHKFPDHTFIIIGYNDTYYIMQSYYYAYSMTGKYGLIKLSPDDKTVLQQLLRSYQEYAKTPIDVSHLNTILSTFTGVNSVEHAQDMREKVGERSCILNIKYMSPIKFAESISQNLGILYTHIVENDGILVEIKYQLYLCFKDTGTETLEKLTGCANFGESLIVYKDGYKYINLDVVGNFPKQYCINILKFLNDMTSQFSGHRLHAQDFMRRHFLH